jgi:acyl-CoA synthetase (AMP-forming)/AMP-acid ligase II
MMSKRNYGKAYAANLHDSIWDIVIPNNGKVSPLLLKARFESRGAADKWLVSNEGARLIRSIQESGRLPVDDTIITPMTPAKPVAIVDQIPELSAAFKEAKLHFPDNGIALTYLDFFERILFWARRLALLELQTGSVVLLIGPNGPEICALLFACQHQGLTPAILNPPSLDIEYFCASTIKKANAVDARLILLDQTIRAEARLALYVAADELPLEIFDFDALPTPASMHLPHRRYHHDAFIQFTSGSTELPRGAVITHSNLQANCEAMRLSDSWSADDVFVSWLPLSHDMGLVGKLFGPVSVGASAVIVDPSAFARRPTKWLRLITEYRGTISAAPNIAYSLCATRLPDSHLQGLDLSSWRCAYNGSEPIRKSDVDAFNARFGSVGFRPTSLRNVYGMAECTLAVSFSKPSETVNYMSCDKSCLEERGLAIASDDPASWAVVSVGPVLNGFEMIIADPKDQKPMADLHVGEVLLRGPSITSGYFGQIPRPADDWFRTGDLGFMKDGELYICGRLKDLIKKAGKSIFPADVESILEKLGGVRPGSVAAFRVQSENAELLGVALEYRGPSDEYDKLIADGRALLHAKANIEADIFWRLRPGEIPKTTSGKIRRSELTLMAASGRLGVA